MFFEWLDSWLVAVALCCFAVIFIFAVSIRLDNKLISVAKNFNNEVECNLILCSRIINGFLQITPMISSFLALTVMLLAFIIYNII